MREVSFNLYMHLDYSLADKGCTKKGPEGNEKMATCYSCQIKQRIRNLWRKNMFNRNYSLSRHQTILFDLRYTMIRYMVVEIS